MTQSKHFDLSEFMTDSLCLNGNVTSPARPMYRHKDPYTYLYEVDPLKILGECDFKKAREVPLEEVGTPIQEFYRGVNVFVTGGSGFLGKVLTEKLLRAMPHIGHIYLLIRPKRGKSCKERFDLLMEDKVFLRMKAEKPHYHTKITALAGDISEPGLGLRDEDRQLVLDTVHVVFHCAADVRFFEPLRKSVESNVLGSKRVMDLVKVIKNLMAYIHVSSAFSQCVNKVIEERVPKMSINYMDILHYIESNTDSHIEDNLQSILQGWPNTYTFSKALCEDMIQEEAEGLPISIFRPSVVIPSNKEPVRGWTDNVYGPTGIILAGALGIMHTYNVNGNQTTDVVPVDYVVNCMIALAWNTGMQRNAGSVNVYNFTSSSQNMMAYKRIMDSTRCVHTWPSSLAIWWVSVLYTDHFYVYKIAHFFLHKIPGHILDKIALLLGQKPRFTKIYNTISKLDEATQYFVLKFWDFKNENAIQLWKSMSIEDRQLLHFDVRDINWMEYGVVSWLGLRYYFLKESMDTIPVARKKFKWLQVAHVSLKLVCGFVVLKLAVYVAHILPI